MAGYGKRPMWQWIVIYLIVGAVVYGLIYYFFMAKNGSSYSYGTPSTPTQQNDAPAAAPESQQQNTAPY